MKYAEVHKAFVVKMYRNSALKAEIDRSSPEPFYLQLTRLIEGAIDRGEFSVGDKLLGESELCRQYELARSTVRETLRTLEDRKRIKFVPRRGAFVIDPDRTGWVLQVTEGFFGGEVDHDRRKVETKVLEAGLKKFPEAAIQALNLRNSKTGFLLRRLRFLDERPALYSENYLLSELQAVVLGSSVMEPHGSLNRVLQESGYRIFGARRSVEAVSAPARVAKLLQVAPGSPLLLVTSVSWKKGGVPFDYYNSWVRTDIVKVTVEASAAIE